MHIHKYFSDLSEYTFMKYWTFKTKFPFARTCFIMFLALTTVVGGITLGLLCGLLLSLGAIIITLVRFPVNFFLTFKVVLRTVVIKRRLKLLVLIVLLVIHIIYPIVCSILVVFGSCIVLSVIFSYQIFLGNASALVDTINQLPDILNNYWKLMKLFTDVMLAA